MPGAEGRQINVGKEVDRAIIYNKNRSAKADKTNLQLKRK